MMMKLLTKTTAADLRQRAEAAEAASGLADQRAAAARMEAARSLADANAEGARTARTRAIEQATEADTQRDLAAELHRRADAAAREEALAAYDKLRANAARSVANSERAIRAVLSELGAALPVAQEAHREAILSCQAASEAFARLPEGVVEAQHPPALFDPLLTDGFTMTRFGSLPVWKVLA
jgi:hypothetical protein